MGTRREDLSIIMTVQLLGFLNTAILKMYNNWNTRDSPQYTIDHSKKDVWPDESQVQVHHHKSRPLVWHIQVQVVHPLKAIKNLKAMMTLNRITASVQSASNKVLVGLFKSI